jgi:hypothetical protein
MAELAFEIGGGLKGLPLGSSKEAVRTFFGSGHQPFKRAPDSDPTDYWADEGVFAYYDSTNHLEAIEFSRPCDPTLNGVSLTTVVMGEATERLRLLDPELLIEPGSAISTKLGIGVWSSTNAFDEPVMSAITFGPGYYG